MGLPARQQRRLDAIETALRSGEPRLASMYSIFTRLTGNEPRPTGEQLPFEHGWRSWRAKLRYFLSARRLRRSWWLLTAPLAGSRPAPRRPFLRLLAIGQIVAVLAVLGLLASLGPSLRPAACTSPVGVHAHVTKAQVQACRDQAVAGK